MVDLSVILPVYNKEKYIKNMLCDLSNQSYENFECIVIDDGSTDNSGLICDDFMKIDSRFRVFHTQNNGVSHARNIGLKIAKGRYITFVDADDRLHFDFLENLFDCIVHNDVDMIISGEKKVWQNMSNSKNIDTPYHGTKYIDDIITDFASIQNNTGIYGLCHAKLIKKDCIKNIYFDENIRLAEDFDFYLKVYEKINKIYFDDKNYYYYLQSADNSSSVVKDNEIDYYTQLNIMVHFKNFLEKKNAYIGMNKVIIDKKMSDYVYFTLFYSRMDKDILKKKFDILIQTVKEENISLCGDNIMKKVIFLSLNKDLFFVNRITFILYDLMRRMWKGLMK